MSATNLANVTLGSITGSATNLSCVQLGVIQTNVGLLSQYNKHATATWGANTEEWTVASGAAQWVWAIWKWIPGGSLGAGNLRVTVYCNSGSTGTIKLMRASPYDGTATPNLTADTSGPGAISAGQTKSLVGSSPNTYQTGYFAITTGFDAHTIDLEITKIEWQVGGGGYQDIWFPNAVTSTYICGGVRLG